jgi:hypothetical protein
LDIARSENVALESERTVRLAASIVSYQEAARWIRVNTLKSTIDEQLDTASDPWA